MCVQTLLDAILTFFPLNALHFYDRAKKAYAIVATGKIAIYANVILKKGVVKSY